jgi:hypothetical protein
MMFRLDRNELRALEASAPGAQRFAKLQGVPAWTSNI